MYIPMALHVSTKIDFVFSRDIFIAFILIYFSSLVTSTAWISAYDSTGS